MTLFSLRHTIMGLLALTIGVAATGGPVWAVDRLARVQLSAIDAQRDIDALDLQTLKKELRATEAVGTFTKLALKSRYDALVADFREFHRVNDGKVEVLRERFESLIGDTLDLLRADDPSLFGKLRRARFGLWRFLSDPVKFSAADGKPKVASYGARKDR